MRDSEAGNSAGNNSETDGALSDEQLVQGGAATAEGESRSLENESVAESLLRVAKAKESGTDEESYDTPDSSDSDYDEKVSDDETSDEEVTDEENSEDNDDDELPPILPPAGWNKAEKQAFLDAPREAQEAFVRREKELQQVASRTQSELNNLKKEYEQKSSLSGELEGDVKAMYGDDADTEQIFRNLLNLDLEISQKPFTLLNKIARANGLSPVAFVDAYDKWVDRGGDDVDNTPLRKPQAKQQSNPELDRLRKKVDELEGFQKTAQQKSVERMIDGIGRETDDAGNLKRPFFFDLEEEIAEVMPLVERQHPQLNMAQRIQKAYEYAVNGNENTRRRIQALRQQETIAVKTKKATVMASKNRPQSSLVGSKSTDRIPDNETAEETLRRVLKQKAG